MPTKEAGSRGRPPVADEPLVQVNIRIRESDLAWLDETALAEGRIGRNAVVRRLIEAARREK